MSVLSACQRATMEMYGVKPAAVFSSQGQKEIECQYLANEVAEDIAKSADWQRLTKLYTVDGDGATEAFPLPDDYDRMTQGVGVHSSKWFDRRYENAETLDRWLDLRILAPGFPPGYWIILDNQFQVIPNISTGDDAEFYYQSKWIVHPATGPNKTEFTQDDDEFILSDRLLTLGIIWRWKAMKGQPYAEDMQSYQEALSQEQTRDRGARVIRSNGNGRWSWPRW